MKKILLLFTAISISLSSFSQKKRSFFNPDTILSVTLDSVMLTGKRGLDITDFVQVMTTDTMFYQAFKNLKKFSFTAENRINILDKKNKVDGKMYRKIAHKNSGKNYSQSIIEKADSGKVYDRKGNYDLYTVEMFSYIFMNEGNTDFVNESVSKGKGDEESYKEKLKTLIFNPGKPVKGIPLISSKTEIFGPELRKYYDYNFYYATYQDSVQVYYFKCKMKPGLSSAKKDDIMIRELTTVFNAKTFDILARYIDMKYTSVPFDFDVKMNIELAYRKEILVPVKINYRGNWDIPFKSPENCTFDIRHYNFK